MIELYPTVTLKRLPDGIDPRGEREIQAMRRAYIDHAWRRRNDRPIPRNVLRFGSAAK